MKKIILSLIGCLFLTTNVANASPISIKVGTGSIDGEHKSLILGSKILLKNFILKTEATNDYIDVETNLKKIEIAKNVLFSTGIGYERFKIKGYTINYVEKIYTINSKYKNQIYFSYDFLFKKNKFYPEIGLKIGTQSINPGIGAIFKVNKKFFVEANFYKRFLYEKVNNTKNTDLATLFLNYSF